MSTLVTIGAGTGGAGTATVSQSVSYSGGDYPAGGVTLPLNTMTNPNSPQQSPQLENLTSGSNTIAVPAGAGGVSVELPATNTASVSFKTVSGDSGTPMGPNGTLTFPFAPGSVPADIYLTAGAPINGARLYWF